MVIKALNRFLKDESGASIVEYAILVALIALAALVITIVLGQQINDTFEQIRTCIIDPQQCA